MAATSGSGGEKLVLWTLSMRPRFTGYMQGVIGEFEKAHPGVRVEWVDIPFETHVRKFTAAAAAGMAPDVINLPDSTYARFAHLGALGDMRPHMSESKAASYFPGAMRLCNLGDKTVAVPWYLSTYIALGNEELLARGGVNADELRLEWTPIIERAEEFYRRAGVCLTTFKLGTDMPLRAMQDGIWPFEVDAGGRMRPALLKPECRELMEKYVRAYRAGALPRASGTGGVEVQVEQYQNGDIALLSTGTNMLERIYDSAPKVYERTRVMPGVTGKLGWRDIATMVLSVGGQSKRPDLATRLALHITSNAAQMELARMVSIIPSTVAALGDEHFAAPSATEMAEPKGKIRLCRHLAAEGMKAATSFYPAVSVWPELATAFDQKMKGVLVDGADYLKTLEEIEVVWGRIMARAPVTSESAMPTRVMAGDFQRSKL